MDNKTTWWKFDEEIGYLEDLKTSSPKLLVNYRVITYLLMQCTKKEEYITHVLFPPKRYDLTFNIRKSELRSSSSERSLLRSEGAVATGQTRDDEDMKLSNGDGDLGEESKMWNTNSTFSAFEDCLDVAGKEDEEVLSSPAGALIQNEV